MINQDANSNWKNLYRIGGIAALIAGILFRRNIGAELSLFSPIQPPDNIIDWFALLYNNKLLGLAYLDVFDLVNYALLAVMFLAMYTALKRTNKSLMTIALTSGLMGIAVYFATNASFSMLALSDQYANTASELEKITLEAAGQALLASHRFGNAGAHPGTGGYMSLLLVGIASIFFAFAMRCSDVFNRASAYVGMVAGGLDLLYCIVFAFAPAKDSELLAVSFIPAAGLFTMIWHIMIGWRLFMLGRKASQESEE